MAEVTLAELARVALEAHAHRGELGLNPREAQVMLKVKGKWGRRTHARLCGRSGPKGQIVTDNLEPEGFLLCSFSATDLLAYVHARTK